MTDRAPPEDDHAYLPLTPEAAADLAADTAAHIEVQTWLAQRRPEKPTVPLAVEARLRQLLDLFPPPVAVPESI